MDENEEYMCTYWEIGCDNCPIYMGCIFKKEKTGEDDASEDDEPI
ncbi:MAG: hypothetical protein PHQ44_07275 [Anaerovibrio sp.]|nr:hypothetical protein [Anaerovibrio sp.]